MEVRVTRTNEVSQQVEVELPAEKIEKEVSRELKKLSRRVREKGFRKGKVPLSVVRRKYGQGARVEAIEKSVQASISEVLGRDELKGAVHAGRPEIKSGVEGGPVVFEIAVENMPEIDPTGYLGVSVEQEKYEVTDEDVTAELERLQKEHTQLVTVEDRKTVLADDNVVINYAATGDGPESEIHQDGQEVDLAAGDALPGFVDGLIGAEVGVEKKITVTLPEDFGLEELAGSDIELAVTVQSIRTEETPGIDDELAKQTGDADTLDELKTQIRERIEESRKKSSEQEMRSRLVGAIVEQNDVTVPPLFLEQQARQDVQNRLQSIMQQGIQLEQLGIDPMSLVEDSKPRIEQAIREALILQGIGKKENIEVSDEDLTAEIEKVAEEQGVPAARLRAQLEQEGSEEQLRTQILFDRVLDFVLGEAKVELVDELTASDEDGEPEADGDADGE